MDQSNKIYKLCVENGYFDKDETSDKNPFDDDDDNDEESISSEKNKKKGK